VLSEVGETHMSEVEGSRAYLYIAYLREGDGDQKEEKVSNFLFIGVRFEFYNILLL